MKMSKEDYNAMFDVFQYNAETIEGHYNFVKSSGKFKVLENRVAWDCLKAFLGSSWISAQYDKGLNDSHITTASVKALKSTLGL